MGNTRRKSPVIAPYGIAGLRLSAPVSDQSFDGSNFATVVERLWAAVAGATIATRDKVKETVSPSPMTVAATESHALFTALASPNIGAGSFLRFPVSSSGKRRPGDLTLQPVYRTQAKSGLNETERGLYVRLNSMRSMHFSS